MVGARDPVLYGAGVVTAIQIGKVPAVAQLLAPELELTLSELGWIISVITLASIFLGALAGSWIETFGGRRSLIVGLLLTAAASGAGALADNFSTLLMTRIAEGIGYLLVIVAAPTLIARVAAGPRQGAALALWGTFVPLGIAISTVLSAALSPHIGWRGVFLVNSGLLAGAAIVVYIIIGESIAGGQAAKPKEGSALLIYTKLSPLLLAAGFGLFAAIFLSVLGFLPTFLHDVKGMSLATSASVTGIVSASGIAGGLAAAWLLARGITMTTIAGVGLVLPAGTAFIAFYPDVPTWVVVLCAVATIGIGGLVSGSVFASVPRVAGGSALIGPVNGLIAQFGSLGSTVGPPVFGAWISATSWTAAPAPIALASTACLLLILLAARTSPGTR